MRMVMDAMGGMGDTSNMGMGGMMLWMLIWGLVGVGLLVLAVVGVVWLVRHTNSRGEVDAAAESPEEVLRRRYAAGELDEDEYLRRRAGLHE
jgi:putative membrane protein